jgi:Trypsin-like peptidase domain
LFDDEMKPRWFEHPYYRDNMDVAVLPIPDALANDHNLMVEPYEPPAAGPDDAATTLMVAQDVFIVGYPYGLESGFLLPLWTRGTIASEPAMFYRHRDRDLPLLLVDARTREGQSGSPVIIYRQPLTPIYTNSGKIAVTGGSQSRI